MPVRHWKLVDIKGEFFTGQNQSQVLAEIFIWIDKSPGISVLDIKGSVIDGCECWRVIYE